jgi:hypothetical protein
MDTYNPELAVGELRVLPPRLKASGAPLEAEPIQPLPYLDMSSWDANRRMALRMHVAALRPDDREAKAGIP